MGMFTGKVADTTTQVVVDRHDRECRHHGCTEVGTMKAVILKGCPCIQVRLLVGLLTCPVVVNAVRGSRRRRATTYHDCEEEANAAVAFFVLCFLVVAALGGASGRETGAEAKQRLLASYGDRSVRPAEAQQAAMGDAYRRALHH